MTKNQVRDKIWRLLAISLDPDRSEPQLYGLILEGEVDQPLMLRDRVLFFRDAARAPAIIETYGLHLRADRAELGKPFFWCDIAQTLHLLQAGGLDGEACVLGAVNLLLDLVRAIGVEVPVEYKEALRSIADYCTTKKDLTLYLEEEGDYSSEALTNAVLWCVGATTVKATILD